MAMSAITTDAKMLAEIVNDLDTALGSGDEALDLEVDLAAWAVIEEANRQLAIVRSNLARQLAEAMPDKRVTVEGVGTFERHRKTDRKKWDTSELLRVVLDTRLVDPDTGEVSDPNPLDKVLHVWNLGAPRVTALRERHIDPDEFAEVEHGALTLQQVG